MCRGLSGSALGRFFLFLLMIKLVDLNCKTDQCRSHLLAGNRGYKSSLFGGQFGRGMSCILVFASYVSVSASRDLQTT